MKRENIRNFSIIAHIDHGKSTLADRLLEFTGAVRKDEMESQILDSMDLERERGITIKAQSVRLKYKADNREDYVLNLIDTPGHVDFTYEVSRSLAACEGVLLVVDATQGIEAQTLANFYLALENDLEIIPVINKIDLPTADIEKVKKQIRDIFGFSSSEIILTSAKEGIGTKDVLEEIVSKIPCPLGKIKNPLKALIFDSWFDNYQGAVVLVRLTDGAITRGMKIKMMSTNKVFEVIEIGIFTPKMLSVDKLSVGEVGYLTASIKEVSDTKVGDTITEAKNPTSSPFPGYKEFKSMVFSGLYPVDSGQYEPLREALKKLRLNDSSFTYEPETSLALGFGFRCGFLGLLHMEIIQERLEREFNLLLLTTAPTVIYKVIKVDGEIIEVDNPTKLPPIQKIQKIEEPFILATIIVPSDFLGAVFKLVQEKRGIQRKLEYIDEKRVLLTYELPLNEIILDFYDRLKSVTRGYASFDYEYFEFRESNLVKLDVLINGEPVDALSCIVHRDKSVFKGRQLIEKMKEIIPRQMFVIIIQAAIGSKIIARETVRALRKNVTAKCYGGDITRKRKLLEKQKEGKKRMKQIGQVEIPQEAFMVLLKVG